MSISVTSTIKKIGTVTITRQSSLDRTAVIKNLRDLRSQLEEGVMTRKRLSQVNVSAGFLLQDVCSAIGLTEAETRSVLGKNFTPID